MNIAPTILRKKMPQFRETLTSAEPPPGLGAALWHNGRGDWEAAHRAAQDIDTPEGAWVHAHLHRKEGDTANAAYWYRRAGKPMLAASARRARATRTERAGVAASECACRGVRGAKPLE